LGSKNVFAMALLSWTLVANYQCPLYLAVFDLLLLLLTALLRVHQMNYFRTLLKENVYR
jgi:hypothetical protein